MKRFARNTTIAVMLGLGLTLGLLWALNGLPTSQAAPMGTTRYVAPWGDDSGNLCTSSITPCRTVQQAVNMAWSGDDKVLVAAGTYTATSGQVLYIPSTVVVRGGYNADFSEWNPQAYLTTLDGQGTMRVVYMQGDITPTLEGLRLTNGYVNGDGGGIYSVNAHPIISGCHIYLNTATNIGDGGGAYLYNAHHAMLMGNEIYSNTADWNGGGISLYASDNVQVADNQIHHNTTENGGGGISYEDSDNATVVDNHVISNTAGWYGAGIYLSNGSDATLTGNLVLSNTVTILGGGLYLDDSDNVTLMNNQVYRNKATIGGGGVCFGSNTTATLVNNMALENQVAGSGNGAGMWITGSAIHMLHNTIARNSGGDGQGIYMSGSNLTVWLTNTILVSHTVGIEASGGAVVTATHILWGAGAWANITDTVGSNIFTGTLATNWWEAPGFLDHDGGDYHIGTGSGAIDKGLDADVAADIDGDSRPFCGGPDLGADETLCCANLNGTLYPTVQSAVDASTDPSDVIKVAGTCSGTADRADNSQTVYVSKTVTVRGGYTTDDWNTSDPDANPTTLDAAKQGRVVTIEGSDDISPTLEGLHITNGSTDDHGGGIYVERASPTISGCQIYSNTAWSGGGVTLRDANGTLLTKSDIHDNTARWGGGIKVDNSHFVIVSNNTFQHNEATNTGGGAIYMSEGHTATVSSNLIYDNSASEGGGVCLVDSRDITLASNTIHDNSATTAGGGLYLEMDQNIVMDNNIVADNQSSGSGGGVYVLDSTAQLQHTTLARNSGQQGVYVYETAIVRLSNTILVSHTVGVETDFGATAYLTATLWGDGPWANTVDTIGSNILTGTLNWWGNPAFVDPGSGDYHLGSGSAAFERGVSVGVLDDIDGDLRSIGLGMQPDLGADEALPALAVTKTGPAWYTPGSIITYTLRITNTGVVTAHMITLSDTLPSGAAFVGASDSGNIEPGSDAVTWLIYSIGPESGVITRTFSVTGTGDIVNDDYLVRSYGTPNVMGTVPVATQFNHVPVADAGPPQMVTPGTLVMLNGSESSDADDDTLIYGWAQTGGPAVTLSSDTAISPTFTSPLTAGTTLSFTLTVTDTFGAADTSVTTVTVKHYIYLPLVLRND